VLLAFFGERRKTVPAGGRGAIFGRLLQLPAPMALFHSPGRSRFGAVVISGGISSVLLQQLGQVLTVSPSVATAAAAAAVPWSLPWGILMTILLAALFYPIAACMAASNRLLAGVLGILYTSMATNVYYTAVR